MKKPCILLIAGLLTVSLLSCGEKKKEANPKSDSDGQVKVLATVNGVPITEFDVKQTLKKVVHGEQVSPGATQNVLETLVRNELVYQQSLELGLDKNPEYQRKLNDIEAQLRDYKRQEMSNLFRIYVGKNAEVTDTEAKEYFDRNSERIRTKHHIWQIFQRGNESGMAQVYKDLKSGQPFEKVASKRFPVLPKGVNAPWDLGYLNWSQIPPPWQGVLDRLKPGEVSDIIKGPGERFWVIKLVKKAVDPAITFATEKEKIVQILRKQKADELYDTMLNQMRTKSKIVFLK